MKKQECSCGSKNFNVDKGHSGRIACANCKQAFSWNGTAFIPTTRTRKIMQGLQKLFLLEKKPDAVKLEIFNETENEKEFKELILREKKEARARLNQSSKSPLPVLTAPKTKKWAKVWKDYVECVIMQGTVKVHNSQHVGKIRGKHVIKEAHRRITTLGFKSRINFGKDTIEFLGDRNKAMKELEKIKTWG